RVFEQGRALPASGYRDWLRITVAGLGSAYTLRGRLAEGRTLLEEAIGEGLRMGVLFGRPFHLTLLSEVCRLEGCWDEAWQHACQALDLARQLRARGGEARALHQLGVVQAHADLPDTAQAAAH